MRLPDVFQTDIESAEFSVPWARAEYEHFKAVTAKTCLEQGVTAKSYGMTLDELALYIWKRDRTEQILKSDADLLNADGAYGTVYSAYARPYLQQRRDIDDAAIIGEMLRMGYGKGWIEQAVFRFSPNYCLPVSELEQKYKEICSTVEEERVKRDAVERKS